MKKKLLLVLTACLATTAFFACNKSPEVGGVLTPVKIAYQPIVFGVPLFVAEQEGLFKKHGVVADSKSFTSANDMINALVAGEVVIVPGAPLVPVLSLESKYPGKFRVFAHSVMTSDKPFDRIIVKEDSSLKSAADLAGKRLALIPGTTALNTIKAFLKKNNVSPDAVNFVQLAPPAQLSALASGAVEALYAYEPTLTVALSKGGFRAISPSIYCSMLEPCPLVVSIIDRDFERKHPKEAAAAIGAINDAVTLMKKDPAKASESLVPYTKIDAGIAHKVSLQNMTVTGEMNVPNLQQFINILVDIGELQSAISADKLLAPTQ